MFPTSAECRTLAEEKLAEADGDKRHRRRLVTAAEGWLFLAGQLRRLEKSLGYDVVEKKGRLTRGLVTISSVSGARRITQEGSQIPPASSSSERAAPRKRG
jgi:hypothetical protein